MEFCFFCFNRCGILYLYGHTYITLDKAVSGQIMSTTVDWAFVAVEEVNLIIALSLISKFDRSRPIHPVKPFFALKQPCQGRATKQ